LLSVFSFTPIFLALYKLFTIAVFQMAQYLQPEEKMAAILSAAGHDLYHPGVNQSFLVATENPLAALYQVSTTVPVSPV